MFDGRRDNGRWAELAIQVEGMAAFIDAPAVIFTAANEMSGLPKVLSVVADPDAAGFFVNREPPGIAQPVRPVFRARVFHAHERIIFGNGVRSRAVRMVDVDAEYAA